MHRLYATACASRDPKPWLLIRLHRDHAVDAWSAAKRFYHSQYTRISVSSEDIRRKSRFNFLIAGAKGRRYRTMT